MAEMLPDLVEGESETVQAMRRFRRAILAQEEAQMIEMARRWQGVTERLSADIELLAREVYELSGEGRDAVTAERITEMRRYQLLLRNAENEFEKYATWLRQRIRDGQNEMELLGSAHARRLLELSLPGEIVGLFEKIPTGAVENMAGLAGDGGPLGDLIWRRMIRDEMGNPLPGVWERLTQTLVESVARGWHPRYTAEMLQNDLAQGLQKGLVIARTEQLRVYREANRQVYEKSSLVEGLERICAHDDRVCAACLADEGTIYPVEEGIFDHPQGRCMGRPVIKSWAEIGELLGVDLSDLYEPVDRRLKGEAWLRQQEENVQRSILGKMRFELWSKGELDFGNVAEVTYHPIWGKGLRVRALGDMMAPGIHLIQRLTKKNVYTIGDIDNAIVSAWDQHASGNQTVILTGERRLHYLERHPEMRQVEDELANVILSPVVVSRNKTDENILIFYREFNKEKYLRATVLMINEQGWKKHSIITYRFAGEKEYLQALGRAIWQR